MSALEIVQLALGQAGAEGQPLPPVGTGRIVGGWGYIWASYIITWVGVAAYGLSLWLRRRNP